MGILRKWRIEAVSWYSGSYADGSCNHYRL
nr:MAG TPA: hypothetical protein [Caudoviricetes sp.]